MRLRVRWSAQSHAEWPDRILGAVGATLDAASHRVHRGGRGRRAAAALVRLLGNEGEHAMQRARDVGNVPEDARDMTRRSAM